MDLTKIRRLTQEAQVQRERELQQREFEEKKKEEERKRREEEWRNKWADDVIAGIPELVKRNAEIGSNWAWVVKEISWVDMVSKPFPKWFGFGKGYSPYCLPPYARKIYDYCRKAGFTTILDSYGLFGEKYYIEIRW